jgi:hypothetical protein
VYQDRKCRPSHMSARIDDFARARYTHRHSPYSLHIDRQKASAGLTAGNWGAIVSARGAVARGFLPRGIDSHRGAVWMTVTLGGTGAQLAEIAGWISNPTLSRLGNALPRLVLKKVLGVPAVAVNDD